MRFYKNNSYISGAIVYLFFVSKILCSKMWKHTPIGLNKEGNLWIKNYQICVREDPPQFLVFLTPSVLSCVLASIIAVEPGLWNTFHIWCINCTLISSLPIPWRKNSWIRISLNWMRYRFNLSETSQNSIWNQDCWRMEGRKAKTNIQLWHGWAVETFIGKENRSASQPFHTVSISLFHSFSHLLYVNLPVQG